MWNDGMDFNEISELTGLRESQVIYLLKDKEINISCDLAYRLIQILYKTRVCTKLPTELVGELKKVIYNWGKTKGLKLPMSDKIIK